MSKKEDGPVCPFEGKDVVLPGPETSTGVACVRHRPDHSLELAELRPAVDGAPLAGEMVKLSGEGPAYEVESLYDPREGAAGKGPAKVATEAYRSGWDSVFGKAPVRGQA